MLAETATTVVVATLMALVVMLVMAPLLALGFSFALAVALALALALGLQVEAAARCLGGLAAALFLLRLLPAWWTARVFTARYDAMTMRVAPTAALARRWDGPQGEQQAAAWAWLSAWCFEGAGTGRAPLQHRRPALSGRGFASIRQGPACDTRARTKVSTTGAGVGHPLRINDLRRR